ncbi:glycosyltransferase [Sneathiella sp.]|uniref:glycosyltransferase n=1 Tax=Sneathiella sp. TaxID=1964365 RepID=UPI003569216E
MKSLLIVAPYSTLPTDKFVNRFSYLARYFADNDYRTTFVTSTFSHFEKSFRDACSTERHPNLEVVLVDEPGYPKNVGLQRLHSIRQFRKNFRRHFPSLEDYDIVYSAYPTIGHNIDILQRIDRTRTALIVDIQDIWPESFSSVVPAIAKVPPRLLPFARAADRVYSGADGLIAVSRTYLARGREANEHCSSLVAYLGSEFEMVETRPMRLDAIQLFYIGTLSYSYDIATVVVAVNRLVTAGWKIELNIFGTGPDLGRLKGLEHRGTCFHGTVPYRELEARLREQHVAVNPIRSGAGQTITNKLCDYLALGCPLLNSQKGWEVDDVLANVHHHNYLAGNVESAMAAIVSLAEDPRLYDEWICNSAFSRDRIVEDIARFVDELRPSRVSA